MHFQPLVAGLALLGVAHAGFYGRNSAVMEVTAKNYDQLIAKSNHTSVSPPTIHCLSSLPLPAAPSIPNPARPVY